MKKLITYQQDGWRNIYNFENPINTVFHLNPFSILFQRKRRYFNLFHTELIHVQDFRAYCSLDWKSEGLFKVWNWKRSLLWAFLLPILSYGMDFTVASYKNRRKSPCEAWRLILRCCFEVLKDFTRLYPCTADSPIFKLTHRFSPVKLTTSSGIFCNEFLRDSEYALSLGPELLRVRQKTLWLLSMLSYTALFYAMPREAFTDGFDGSSRCCKRLFFWLIFHEAINLFCLV